jgi:conjugal transfer pilus assembly protein TraF
MNLFAANIVTALSISLMPSMVAAQPAPQATEMSATHNVSASDMPEGNFYCLERKLGTWFYCDRPKSSKAPPQTSESAAKAATLQLAAIGKELDALKALAILEPSEQNVTTYIRFQREQLDRASTFSDQWQRVIWQNPDLDYTLQRPVSTLGKRVWIDNRKAEEETTLQRLSARYGIFYFYAMSCGACDIFAPILKSLAEKSHFSVVAVSMDGGPSKVFPDYVVDAGQYARMGLPTRATPALVLYDTQTHKPVPIGTGILSANEIVERIFVLTHTSIGSDF